MPEINHNVPNFPVLHKKFEQSILEKKSEYVKTVPEVFTMTKIEEEQAIAKKRIQEERQMEATKKGITLTADEPAPFAIVVKKDDPIPLNG